MRRIDTIWAVIAEDQGDDTEGVVAFQMPDGAWMPLIAADPDRLHQIEAMGAALANARQQQFKLIKLTTREVIGTIGGTSQ